MKRNLSTRLPRAKPGGMRAFDRLPPKLRRWLQQAVLPWSAASAYALWQRSLRETAAKLRPSRACRPPKPG